MPAPTSESAALVKDVSIIGGVVVVLIIIMISFTVFMVIRFLRSVVDTAETDLGPAGACAAEISAAQANYQQKINPATGDYYTQCASANLAVGSVAADPETTCPRVTPPATARPPFSIFVSAQCAPPPPAPD